MNIFRCKTIKFMGSAAPAFGLSKALAQLGDKAPPSGIDVTPGPFAGTRASLKPYVIPRSFADAKFYAFEGWSVEDILMQALCTHSPQQPQKIIHIGLFGRDESLHFTQDAAGLRIKPPPQSPLLPISDWAAHHFCLSARRLHSKWR